MDELEDIFDNEVVLETPVFEDTRPLDQTESPDSFFDEPSNDNKKELSLLDTFLEAKGIKDAKITILDENEEAKELNFYDLSREEQLEILNSVETPESNDLEDTEIDLINHLRTNNLSVEDFLTQYKEAILAEVQQQVEPSYDIDAYGDEELYILDLKQKYDLTDEELQKELEKELENQELFNKKVTKLRSEYKQLEDQYKASQQAEFENKRQEEYTNFVNTMSGVAEKIEDFHGVFLDGNEKTETLSYLLDLDATGVSQFSKDLNNPQKLYEAAWYLRYGAEAFKALENAYEAEIAKLKKIDKPRVVVQNSKPKSNSIYDLQ